jgi:hypothetical protein
LVYHVWFLAGDEFKDLVRKDREQSKGVAKSAYIVTD